MTKTKLNIKNIIIAVSILIVIIVAIIFGVKIKKDLDYKKTYEYKLLQIGYSKDDTTYLIDTMKDNELDDVLGRDLNENIPKLLKEKYYLQKNLDKYLTYANENIETNLTDVVALINVDAYKDWYKEIVNSDISKDNLLIVNKFYKLNNDYEPDDLVAISNWYAYDKATHMRAEAYDKFVSMYNAAKTDGMTLIINSSYRTYAYQEDLWNRKKTAEGQESADNFVARAGHSEHQTGLAIDITTYGVKNFNFEEFEEFEWMQKNAYKYGYILRYPKDKEYITGYSYESWHYRYVGVEVATYIYQNQITFDEYYAYFLVG